MLWLGSVLTNGQFYQATLIIEFDSKCNDERFYERETNQIVYVSLADRLPFYYEPVPIVAITPEIDKVCKSQAVQEEISFMDSDGQIANEIAMMITQ